MKFNLFVSLLWVIAAIVIALGSSNLFAGVSGGGVGVGLAKGLSFALFFYAAHMAYKEWTRSTAEPAEGPVVSTDGASGQRASGPTVPLEQQIAEFAAAGLSMAPGRTVDELLISWPRSEYENDDPYQLLLYSYANAVEREPYDEWFTGCGWNWDTECITEPGSYVRLLRQVERITGEALFTALTDTAQYAPSGTGEITYAIKGGPAKTVEVALNHDWADVAALLPILEEMQTAVGDGRRFYCGDNGQSILLFFITDKTAAGINALKSGLLDRMV